MPWLPENLDFGPHAEFEQFSHNIQYYTEEAGSVNSETGEVGESTITWYNVRIIPIDAKPETITITSGNPANITGYYKRVFNDVIEYLNFNDEIKTVSTEPNNGAWDKVNNNISDVMEVTSFEADISRSVIKTYRVEAYSSESQNIVATTEMKINIRDLNWSTGQQALKEIVAYTSQNNIKNL